MAHLQSVEEKEKRFTRSQNDVCVCVQIWQLGRKQLFSIALFITLRLLPTNSRPHARPTHPLSVQRHAAPRRVNHKKSSSATRVQCAAYRTWCAAHTTWYVIIKSSLSNHKFHHHASEPAHKPQLQQRRTPNSTWWRAKAAPHAAPPRGSSPIATPGRSLIAGSSRPHQPRAASG